MNTKTLADYQRTDPQRELAVVQKNIAECEKTLKLLRENGQVRGFGQLNERLRKLEKREAELKLAELKKKIDTSHLLRCPFCGEGNKTLELVGTVKTKGRILKIRQVRCNNCGAAGPIKDTFEEAAKIWNGLSRLVAKIM